MLRKSAKSVGEDIFVPLAGNLSVVIRNPPLLCSYTDHPRTTTILCGKSCILTKEKEPSELCLDLDQIFFPTLISVQRTVCKKTLDYVCPSERAFVTPWLFYFWKSFDKSWGYLGPSEEWGGVQQFSVNSQWGITAPPIQPQTKYISPFYNLSVFIRIICVWDTVNLVCLNWQIQFLLWYCWQLQTMENQWLVN